MAKKKAVNRRSGSRSRGTAKTTSEAEVLAAEERLRMAREALHQAEEHYETIRGEASAQIEKIRKTNVGDVVDGTLDFVRKHPGPGVLAAAVVGFVVGRLVRRIL